MTNTIAHLTLHELGTGAGLFLAGAICAALLIGALRRREGGPG